MAEAYIVLSQGTAEQGTFALINGTCVWDGPDGLVPMIDMTAAQWGIAGVIVLGAAAIAAVANLAWDGCGIDSVGYASIATGALVVQQFGTYQAAMGNLGGCVLAGWGSGPTGDDGTFYALPE